MARHLSHNEGYMQILKKHTHMDTQLVLVKNQLISIYAFLKLLLSPTKKMQ